MNTRRQRAPLLWMAAAFGTMFYAGLTNSGSFWVWRQIRAIDALPRATEHALWRMPEVWGPGLGYAVALMAILFAHEMGHYLTARRYGVGVSFPLFIPFLPPLGTLGAVIRMDVAPMPARSLMRIAAFGPFAGIVVAVPVVLAGLALSDVRQLPPDFEGMRLGTCLLFKLAERLVVGPIPEGHDVFLHPLALAGWAGCLVTGLNLLPFGQLDGGHVAYALLGPRYNRWIRPAFALACLALVAVNPGYLLFLALVWFMVRVEHPDIVTDLRATGVDRRIGLLAVLLFIVTFTPRPFISDWASLFG